MSECKTIEDMENTASELLINIVNKSRLSKNKGMHINFEDAIPIIQAYLLDKYNEGYDDAIVPQCRRVYKID